MTRELALELGPEIADHCFGKDGKIRDEMTGVQIRLKHKPQVVTARMAIDVTEPTVVMRHVRVTHLSVTKRGVTPDQAEATKGKKVAPQAITLRATLICLIDPKEKVNREFLCSFIHDTFLFSFEAEEKDLFEAMRANEREAENKDPNRPLQFPAAGDVLDEQREREARSN